MSYIGHWGYCSSDLVLFVGKVLSSHFVSLYQIVPLIFARGFIILVFSLYPRNTYSPRSRIEFLSKYHLKLSLDSLNFLARLVPVLYWNISHSPIGIPQKAVRNYYFWFRFLTRTFYRSSVVIVNDFFLSARAQRKT